MYSPCFPASAARPLSSRRGKMAYPPNRTRGLRGGRWVKSGAFFGRIGCRLSERPFQSTLSCSRFPSAVRDRAGTLLPGATGFRRPDRGLAEGALIWKFFLLRHGAVELAVGIGGG